MQALQIIRRWSVALAALCAVAACDMDQMTSAMPQARPAGLVQPVARPTSQASAALRSYLVQVQSAQLNQGLLRDDGGGPDTPFTADMLARNFEQIVFYNEYASALQGRGGKSPLRRWSGPVRVSTIFGAGVPPSQRTSDAANVKNYARRLGQITDHPVSSYGPANFIVIIAGEDDRDTALDLAAARLPGISARSLDPLRDLDRDTYCVVAAYASGRNVNTYTAAVAVIRAENPGLLRLSCIHEEMAQGLGLANDSRDARPSIFNDDDEFALLTSHDELLLKMLYDPRLKPGMSATEAAPVTRIIARELTSSGPL
ncbi:DUF2927 domain-containing protein [Roseobacter weihaiensis]|uniref:DUF2927 domain-containing protein n=1 Tax=Roseobacter weihaiensis TaxID=2763262 RepID=UPI001D0A36CD|nr:DUF2927 domain-containing protein [Roseobacter sp. H9]